MKTALLILGIVAVLMGLLFAGQGAGIIMWPASSSMLNQSVWTTRGTILAVLGVVLIILAWRR